ncbi:VWA domain-containing protein [Pseudanabaena sp. FACHB-2040]|nr:VWA domain-containing protein [Pseudanabaena sp. FACHB-2040]
MSQPQIELLPMHAALAASRSTTLDLLIKVVPPTVTLTPERPPLNLNIALDRSGSMSGSKLDYAKQAACYAIENLLPCDRISITLFDTHVKTLIPSTLATDKAKILEALRSVTAGSSTALHAGWVEGGTQVGQYLHAEHLNRVILLSDGLANVGETQPDAISSDVSGLAKRGVSTSALGVGNDYDEDLLEAMARSGDGNFYHIESPDRLPAIFENELMGLSATLGRQVNLGLTPQNGVVIKDMLNDLDTTEAGAYKLPNLVVGVPINLVVRLQIPAMSQISELCQICLSWDDPNQSERQSLQVILQMPVVKAEQMSDFPAHPEVQEQVALLMAARARKEAIDRADAGDLVGASRSLRHAQSMIAAMPQSLEMCSEMDALKDLDVDFLGGHTAKARKKALSQRFDRQRSRPAQPTPPTQPTDPTA